MADTMKSLEDEAAQIHEEMEKCKAMLADVAKRRDALVLAEDIERAGGIERYNAILAFARTAAGDSRISVPVAKIKAN